MFDLLPKILEPVIDKIISSGGCPVIVGGSVRDWCFNQIHGTNHEIKDFDVEVFELSSEQLLSILSQFGNAGIDGESFAVFHLSIDGQMFDFSIPRTERKTGNGHADFEASFDPHMTFKQAASRRDFTFNAMGWDLIDGELLDPFNGQSDVRNFFLRPVDSETFVEDPLRVLRGFQFAARFHLVATEEFIHTARSIVGEFKHLSRERVADEWTKFLELGIYPSAGLDVLRRTNWIVHFHKLHLMPKIEQDALHHPEGNLWQHTLHSMSAMSFICQQLGITGSERVNLMAATLTHDIGKISTTFMKDSRWVSPKHAPAGEEIARIFWNKIYKADNAKKDPEITQFAVDGCVEHMVLTSVTEVTPRLVRRLASRLQVMTIRQLCLLIDADKNGRPFTGQYKPAFLTTELRAMADELDILENKPQPILGGRHLIELGMSPGKEFGKILADAFEAQMDGQFDDVDEGILWLQSNTLLSQ